MEHRSRFSRPSTYDQTFIVCRWIFSFIFPIFYKGYQQNGLGFKDLNRCPKDDEAERILVKLKRSWNKELKRSNPKLWRALLNTFGSSFIFLMIVYLFEECFLRILQPILLGRVIEYFKPETRISFEEACWCAAGVTGCTWLFISLHHPNMLQAMRVGMRMRVACCSLMYQKALRLSRASVDQTAVGQIINIMSNDVNRMDEFTIFVSYLIVSPIQTIIVVYIVYQYLDWTCFVGIALLILLIPFQAFMGKLFSNIRLKTARLTDNRLRYMTEIISGIRVIKMYCWELPFAKRVSEARRAEVVRIRQSCYLKAINLSVFFVATRIMLFMSFVAYVLLGNRLTPEAVFVSMALLNTLRLTMTFFFPQAISLGSELSITCNRIEKFLLMEEMPYLKEDDDEDESTDSSTSSKKEFKQDNLQTVTNGGQGKKEGTLDSNLSRSLVQPPSSKTTTRGQDSVQPKLVINNIVAKWSADLIQPTLQNISVRLKPGDLLAVIGPVGSGKSSLLMAILKELPLISGQIEVEGSISYASQDPWSFNESVRNNILFGMRFDRDKYAKVIEVCALERDLKLMPFGDRTLVGEKGVSLSGGQKARINLARAVYRDADIFLLDDPLSAVDTAVAEHIFEKCISEYLRTRIRILVTHQIQFIKKATKIMILKEGGCLALGSFQELQQMGIDFMSLLEESELQKDQQKKTEDDLQRKLSYSSSHSSISLDPLQGRPRTLSHGQEFLEFTPGTHHDDDDYHDGGGDGQDSIKLEEEKFESGSIKFKVYKEYLKAGSGPVSLLVMIFFTLSSQFLFHGSDLFLTYWTNKNQQYTTVNDTTTVTDQEQHHDIIIYSILIIFLFITTIVRAISFFQICMRASENLHDQIFERLLRAKVVFFDQNPVGRILNRFTKDLGIIDEMLPNTSFDLNLTVFQAIGIVITVSIVSWYLIIPAFILAIIIWFVRGIYIKSARDIKRLEGLARSPVYSHVSTTINGLASIRAFGVQKSFEKQFFVYQNDHSATWFLFISSSRCMGLIIDWVSTIYIAMISIVVMLSTGMLPGYAGLAISSGLMLAGMTQWGVRQSAEFESQMTSVERIVEYQNLEKEPAQESDPDKKPPADWPTKGKIVFDHMSLSYPNSPKPVLKDIDCIIHGGEKIGIVGRTGAGKSSMIAALFRLVEIDGAIWIDEINTKMIGLDDLRKKLSIIPQDPVVFTGTVRYNLDPFDEYPDDKIWFALEEVQLKSQVNNYKGKLEALISESGGNLSVGQRQLICLARAILKNNRILILDEATANVDHQTDTLIQRTIREKFHACTVLTIAHRLNTIIDCDRVLVLDAGKIVEFDIPYYLIRQHGIFYDMCKKTGPAMFSNLYQLAKVAHNNKLKSGANKSKNISEDPGEEKNLDNDSLDHFPRTID